MNDDSFFELMIKHMTDEIENPGEVSATEVFTVPVPSNWPMTIAALALLLDMPPAPPKSLVPGLCRAADYST